MRLLIVTNLYPPQELGGYGQSLAEFGWGLKQLGHQISVLCNDASYLGPSGSGANGESVYRQLQLKGSFKGGVSLIKDPKICCTINAHNSSVVNQLLEQQSFDGILLGNIDLLGPELINSLIKPGIPVLHHVGFMEAPFLPQHFPNVKNYQLIAASRAVRQSLNNTGLPVQNAAVVYPGARVDLYGNHSAAPITSKLGSPSNPIKICFAGLLMASKGAHTLVEAAGELHHQGITAQINLAGSEFQPGYLQQLKQHAQQTGIKENFHWFGQLNRSKLSRFLSLHHIGVFPSIYPEAFGIVAAEIQASGLALVSSGVGGASEIFEHDVSGLQFLPGRADHLASELKRLVDDPTLLKTIRQNGQQSVRTFFNVIESAKQLEQLFHSSIDTPRQPICFG